MNVLDLINTGLVWPAASSSSPLGARKKDPASILSEGFFHEFILDSKKALGGQLPVAVLLPLISQLKEEKRSYKAALQKRRCIVPVSGFYEWKRAGTKKTPFAIYLKDNPIMSLAGIYEKWTDADTNETVNSFSLVTTAANSFMSEIHDRMPVILLQEDEELWLNPEVTDPASISSLMKGCPAEWLKCHPVSTAVNSPKNNSIEILKAI